MKRSEVEQHCLELVTPIIEENNLKLWDVCYEKEGSDYYLRVYVDKEDGVTIDDCVMVSRALDVKLDEADKIKDAYILEVSSPGLTRPLKRENDFKNSIGRLVDIKFYKQQEIGTEKRKDYTGVLKDYDDTSVVVADGADDEAEMRFLKSDISSIRLSYVD